MFILSSKITVLCAISIDHCMVMYKLPCFVNIEKPDLQVHPQPWSCICDISVNVYLGLYVVYIWLTHHNFFFNVTIHD